MSDGYLPPGVSDDSLNREVLDDRERCVCGHALNEHDQDDACLDEHCSCKRFELSTYDPDAEWNPED